MFIFLLEYPKLKSNLVILIYKTLTSYFNSKFWFHLHLTFNIVLSSYISRKKRASVSLRPHHTWISATSPRFAARVLQRPGNTNLVVVLVLVATFKFKPPYSLLNYSTELRFYVYKPIKDWRITKSRLLRC